MALILPLSFHPTLIIGLDKDLQVPKWEIRSRGKKKLFANPPNFASEVEAPVLQTSTLSIKRKVPPQEKEKEKEKEEKKEEEKVEPEEVEEEEQILVNPSRVTIRQLQGIEFSHDQRYTPITGEIFHGFVMLKDNEG
jgi:26S proteasome regulatory subunit N2